MADSNRMYIVAMRSKERMELQYIPFSYDYKRAATQAAFEVIGRNIPRFQYTGGDTDLSLTIEFTSVNADRTDVIQNCTWLESLAASDGYDKTQEKISLVFGDLFRKKEWVITTCDIQYSNVHADFNYRPAEAVVKLGLKLVSDYNLTYDDIRYRNRHEEIAYGTLAPQVIVPEVADSTVVSDYNPYADGTIVTKDDGNVLLKREKLAMTASFLAQATYRAIVQGESVESIAYLTLRDAYPNAEKYWWILSDLNGMNGDPIDIPQQIGRELLIPNVPEVMFKVANKV